MVYPELKGKWSPTTPLLKNLTSDPLFSACCSLLDYLGFKPLSHQPWSLFAAFIIVLGFRLSAQSCFSSCKLEFSRQNFFLHFTLSSRENRRRSTDVQSATLTGWSRQVGSSSWKRSGRRKKGNIRWCPGFCLRWLCGWRWQEMMGPQRGNTGGQIWGGS